jgi:transglutaminase-like putative cysteine protease
MARLTRRFDVPPELPVAALVAAAALPLSRLFRPGGFTGVVLTTVALSIAISWAARRLRLPAVLGLLLSVAGLLWYLALRFYPHSLWGIFPTPSSVSSIVSGVHEGMRRTVDEAVPVVASRELLMFVAAGTWVSAWLADAAAVWVGNPLLAIAATIPLFATPSTLLPSQRRWVDTGLYVAAAAWVLFAEERARAKRWRTSEARLGWRPGPAVRVAIVGLLVIVVLAPFLPGYGAPPLLRSTGPGDRISFNPFVAIQATLRKQPELVLFTVTTNRPAYARLTTLEHYDGETFRQGNVRASLPIGRDPILAFEPDLESQVVRQRYQIQALAGPWLPAAYDPVSVAGVSGVKIETQTRSLVLPSSGGLPTGASYQVTSAVPTFTAADLDKPFIYDQKALSDYLQLPSVPRQIRDVAQRVAGDKPTPYQKALALQDYLRTFTYNENVAKDMHHSFKNLVEFLTKSKQGYCEQFAAAMAVMARTLGLPSRVAIGFGFGEPVGDEIRVTTREAHAWTEIFFPGAGWVAFEPTPRAGVTQVPTYARTGTDLPSVAPTPTPTAAQSLAPVTPGASHGPAEDPAGPQSTASGRPAWVFVVVIAGAALVLLALLAASFPVVRVLRRRRARGARRPSVVRYVEFLNWCAGAGFGRHSGETPAEHAARLGADEPTAVEPMNALAALADKALWAPPNGLDPDQVAHAADAAREALSGTLSRSQRLLAASGWGRWRAED